MPVPTFSLPDLIEAEPATLARLDAALMDPGAFRLSGSSVAPRLIEDMHRVTAEFFRLPMADKTRYRYAADPYVGWCGGEYLSAYGSADRKEMYHIGPRVAPTLRAHASDGSVPEVDPALLHAAPTTCDLWPAQPKQFVATWHEYYRAMQVLAVALGRAFAATLGVDSGAWFDALADNWGDLAANYYPPLDPGAGPTTSIYNAAHRDLTVFTILHQDNSPIGGLSVELVDGSWEQIRPVSGTLVVNVGELLTYLSGGRWRAAPHQVTVSPPAGGPSRERTESAARISIPFFYRPNDARIVRSFVDPMATPVAVGDWVLERKRSSTSTA